MGSAYVTFRSLFDRLGVDYVLPPATTQRTLSLGVQHSPEGLCIPFKLTLGNLIEAVEMGADTLVMPAGFGICRLSYYAKAQEQILHDLGYDVEMVKVGVSERKFLGFLEVVKRLSNNASWPRIILAFRFALAKMGVVDGIERRVHKIRPRELVKGTANRLYKQAVVDIDRADDDKTLRRVQRDCISQLEQIALDDQAQPLVVGITGEFYVLLEPFSSLDVESELGRLGVEVRRKLFISDWTKFSFFLNLLGIDEKRKVHRAAQPYLKRDVGGDGWESVGEKVLHARDYDGLIHLAPFTCMPEIMARNIMLKTKEEIPVLTILCDEQIAKPGMLTRLEAFVDLLQRRRRKQVGCGKGRG